MKKQYNKLTDDEFEKMMRLLADNDTVSVGHLKNIVRQLRLNGKGGGRTLGNEALVLLSDMLLECMVDDVMSRRLVN